MDFIAIPTSYIFYFAAVALCFLSPSHILRSVFLLAVPLVALLQVCFLELGNFYEIQVFGLNLELMRVDKLSKVFGIEVHQMLCKCPKLALFAVAAQVECQGLEPASKVTDVSL